MGGLILVLALLINAQGPAQEHGEKAAFQTAAQAYYIQSGAKEKVDLITKRYVPKDCQFVISNAMIIQRTIQEQRIVLQWGFP